MSMNIKLDTDNFLHTNPSLYLAFNGEHDQSMAQFIHKLFIEYNVGQNVLDVGSGPGREAAYLTERGYAVTGLDNSKEMLSWAKEHYPELPFVYGDQSDFSINQRFDAVYCAGSTFLYNFSNEAVLSSLQCFRKHLQSGGLLYLDMRNAAFFLTKEGQRWLTEELVEQRIVNETVISLQTRFSIDLANQLLERDYCWTVKGMKPVVEHLKHRLLFPQELAHYLALSGFRLLQLFDKPAPHVHKYDLQDSLIYSHDLLGTRMQVIAQAI
ncbi:SAM-dependent methyltransferase [Paenibacillus sp. FSL H8-0548]|uniref:class I SAM-dependent methyltransferase n=1 Tax=Paenibacillus sp. FSL H8-0548 TaxID=1920422 RepID=UPI00096DE7BC|nr:class I SAM-dependent methyltransferase [Paenibacillus sp. FSL H8-0548]OMF26279.1 SAM-dependent methyltransferase [Paenibacillus sp. FSL H8-0548]